VAGEGVRVAGLGLLVLAHGAAECLDEVEAYYAHILHGRRVPAGRLEALLRRYRAIGGGSPLNRLTRAQAAGIAAALRDLGLAIHVATGFLHTPPFIEDALRQLQAGGVRRVVVLVMTPYYSPLGTGVYFDRVQQAAGSGLDLVPVRQWHDEPGFVELLHDRVRAALDTLPAGGSGPCHVIFTAHSLPLVGETSDDPYVDQFTATARAIAARLGLDRWSTCYQSASLTGTPWLGPDVLDELDRVRATGARQVVICPTSFAADNLEVLYDIGFEARRHAQELGMAVALTAPLNDDPALLNLLARAVARRLGYRRLPAARSRSARQAERSAERA